MYFDFKATGNAVQGLQREFTPGSSNQIALDVANCPGVLTAVTTLAEGDDCVVAPGYGGSRLIVCNGKRSAIVDLVGRILRLAFTNSLAP